jgi:hypothetical protein
MKRSKVLFTAVGALSIMTLAACGSSETEPTSQVAEETVTEAVTPTETETEEAVVETTEDASPNIDTPYPLSGVGLTEADFPNATTFTEVEMTPEGVVNIPPIIEIDEYTLAGGDYGDYSQDTLFDPKLIDYVTYENILENGAPKNVVYLTDNESGTPMALTKQASGSDVVVVQEFTRPNETEAVRNVFLLKVS